MWGNMAAGGVVCRSKVLLVFDLHRTFSLSCFVRAGACNKVTGGNWSSILRRRADDAAESRGSWARRPHHCRRLCTGRSYPTFAADTPPTARTDGGDTTQETPDAVTVEYYRGLPQVTVPLPSRRERCRFTLRPISNTVGDFLTMLKHEDKGIDRVAVATVGGVRIASSNTIEALMEDDFQLVVNDNLYYVNTPKQEKLSQEELRRLSDVRTLVNQLYEALNVEEHQLHKERQLTGHLEELLAELEPLEKKRRELDEIADRRTNVMVWGGLGFMAIQFGILARLTWWEYSWDIMEPVTYFVTYGTAMAAYGYFVLTRQEYLLPDVRDREHLKILHKRARKVGLDLERYNVLKNSVSRVEYDLERLRDPLYLHLPTSEASNREKSPLRRAQDQIRNLLSKTKPGGGS